MRSSPIGLTNFDYFSCNFRVFMVKFTVWKMNANQSICPFTSLVLLVLYINRRKEMRMSHKLNLL